MEHHTALNAIQLAVAPVFMLTAIATLIGGLANRLARIIDRARDIEEKLEAGAIRNESSSYTELDRLKMRGLVVNASLALLTVAATLIGATVLTLFLGETSSPRTEVLVPWGFIGGVVCFILALLCFLTETLLAAHTLKFASRLRGK